MSRIERRATTLQRDRCAMAADICTSLRLAAARVRLSLGGLRIAREVCAVPKYL